MFNRELVFFRVGKPVSVVERRRTADGSKRAEEIGQIVVGRAASRILGRKVLVEAGATGKKFVIEVPQRGW